MAEKNIFTAWFKNRFTEIENNFEDCYFCDSMIITKAFRLDVLIRIKSDKIRHSSKQTNVILCESCKNTFDESERADNT